MLLPLLFPFAWVEYKKDSYLIRLNCRMAPDGYNTRMRRIHRLILDRNFRRALPLAGELARDFPADALSQVAHSICEWELGDDAKALEILVLANITLPNNRLIVFQTAETLNRLERYEQAEGVFERTPTFSERHPARTLGMPQWPGVSPVEAGQEGRFARRIEACSHRRSDVCHTPEKSG